MTAESHYDSWVNKKFQDLSFDDETMSSYISSIVTSDETESEKKESLTDIIFDLRITGNVTQLVEEILNKWTEIQENVLSEKKEENVDVSNQVAFIMGQQAQSVLKVANRSEEEEKLREAILSYSFVSSEEDDDDSDEVPSSTFLTAQNQNVGAVVQAEKEKREKMKTEAEKKKVLDKDNREKQKQKQDERREKERKRTQKREHRR